MNSNPGRSKSVGSTSSPAISETTSSGTAVEPICCVIAPDSPSLIAEPRIMSSRLVFPWSTWPSTATIGVLTPAESSCAVIAGHPITYVHKPVVTIKWLGSRRHRYRGWPVVSRSRSVVAGRSRAVGSQAASESSPGGRSSSVLSPVGSARNSLRAAPTSAPVAPPCSPSICRQSTDSSTDCRADAAYVARRTAPLIRLMCEQTNSTQKKLYPGDRSKEPQTGGLYCEVWISRVQKRRSND